MSNKDVINIIKEKARKVLPEGSGLYLYGSRARGNARTDSDWDLLLLLDKENASDEDYAKYAYPIQVAGFDLWQYFSIQMYTRTQWKKMTFTPYYKNVEQDKIVLL